MKDRAFLEQALKTSMRETKRLKDKCTSQSPIRLPVVQKKQVQTATETDNSEQFKRTLAHYQHILDNERKNKRKLQAKQLEPWLQRSELEELFVSCVEEVRRTKLEDVLLTELRPKDKRRILERFVSSDRIVRMVSDQMFKSPTASQVSVGHSPRAFSLAGDQSINWSTSRSSVPSKRRGSAKKAIVKGKLMVADYD
jgi:hypothetical protein